MCYRVFASERVRCYLSGLSRFIFILLPRYWQDRERTEQVMRLDPNDTSIVWMHTGDEGIIDKEGYLRSSFFAVATL